jgi:hypothetical protein
MPARADYFKSEDSSPSLDPALASHPSAARNAWGRTAERPLQIALHHGSPRTTPQNTRGRRAQASLA